MMKVLLSLAVCLSFYTGFCQKQIGYRYNITVDRINSGDVNYTVSDTLRDTANNVASVTINNYLAGRKTTESYTDTSAHYPIFIIDHPGLAMCTKLKAALSQKDESGKVYISFRGIGQQPDYCEYDDITKRLKPGEFYYQIPQTHIRSDINSSITVNYATTDLGIVTIPFKYHYRFTKNSVHVPDNGSANLNAGLYVGRRWGRTKFYTDKRKTKDAGAVLLGGFIGPTIIKLRQSDAYPTNNTTLLNQLQNKTYQLGFSTGFMGAYCYKDFNIGGFLGFDFGLNPLGRLWYYSGKPVYGIGFGYRLATLGKK
jgi:hypothetical protein